MDTQLTNSFIPLGLGMTLLALLGPFASHALGVSWRKLKEILKRWGIWTKLKEFLKKLATHWIVRLAAWLIEKVVLPMIAAAVTAYLLGPSPTIIHTILS